MCGAPHPLAIGVTVLDAARACKKYKLAVIDPYAPSLCITPGIVGASMTTRLTLNETVSHCSLGDHCCFAITGLSGKL